MGRQKKTCYSILSSCRIGAALCACSAFAQPGPGSAQKFEVLSIKRCAGNNPYAGKVYAKGDRITFECVPLESLIRDAYVWYADGTWERSPLTKAPVAPRPLWQMNLPIKGSTGWIQSELYTLNGKSNMPADSETMRGPMMRPILEDRFHVKVHHEQQEMQVNRLVAAKGGAKAQPHKVGTCMALTPENGPPQPQPGQSRPLPLCESFAASPRGGVDIFGVSMSRFAGLFTMVHPDLRAIDQTGLTGLHDIHLDVNISELIRRGPPAPAAANGEASDPTGSLIGALHKIGFALQGARLPVDVLVIDRAGKPTAN